MNLKPCPFCGGEATKHCLNSKETIANGTAEGFKIRCIRCNASITRKGLCPIAIDAWNLRNTTGVSSPKIALIRMLIDDNKRLRNAGCKLSEAAFKVATEYDGVHRLMLAVAEWAKAIANEGGRETVHNTPEEVAK